nr:MAG TPA: hypothetical protein [Caudoviricetes sp.]
MERHRLFRKPCVACQGRGLHSFLTGFTGFAGNSRNLLYISYFISPYIFSFFMSIIEISL